MNNMTNIGRNEIRAKRVKETGAYNNISLRFKSKFRTKDDIVHSLALEQQAANILNENSEKITMNNFI